METKQALIARITAAYAKAHPDVPGIFAVEELRCPNCETGYARYKVKIYEEGSTHKYTEQVLPQPCRVCNGTGYRPPGLKFLLKKIYELKGPLEGYPKLYPIHDMGSGKLWWYCELKEMKAGNYKSTTPGLSTYKTWSDPDPEVVALTVFLAVVEEEAK